MGLLDKMEKVASGEIVVDKVLTPVPELTIDKGISNDKKDTTEEVKSTEVTNKKSDDKKSDDKKSDDKKSDDKKSDDKKSDDNKSDDNKSDAKKVNGKAGAVKIGKKNINVGTKKGTGKAKKPAISGKKTAELKKQMEGSSLGKKEVNKSASKLHTHLHTVGEDGLTHKERLELEIAEQAKKIKKVIWIVCGCILAFIGLVLVVRSCSSSSKPVSPQPVAKKVTKQVSRQRSAKLAYELFKDDLTDLQQQDTIDKAELDKKIETIKKKFPELTEDVDKKVERFLKFYGDKLK